MSEKTKIARILSELRAPAAARFYPPGFTEYLNSCDTLIEYATSGIALRVVLPASEATPVFRQRCARVFRRALALARDPFFAVRAAIVVNIVPSPAKRSFPPPGAPIGPEHINGGFTYVSAAPAEIYVLRREEFPKVVLHEILHHSRVHSDDAAWAPHRHALYAHFNVSERGCSAAAGAPAACDTDIRPNEAIVETWATVQQCAALSRELGVPLAPLLAAERDHVLAVAARCERHRLTLANGEWQERTHAFSYIQLRAIILRDLPGFLEAAGAPEYDAAKAARWLLSAPPLARAAPTAHGADTLRMSLLGDM
jgi:hypothetical protein